MRETLGTALPQITSLTTFTLFRWIYFHGQLRDWFNDEEQIKCYEDISDAVRARARELARAKNISNTKEEAAVAGVVTEQRVEKSSLLHHRRNAFFVEALPETSSHTLNGARQHYARESTKRGRIVARTVARPLDILSNARLLMWHASKQELLKLLRDKETQERQTRSGSSVIISV